MCISIVDESGNLVAFERMDGGKVTSITISADKAYTAAAARKATHEYNAVNVPGNLAFGIHTEVGGRLSSVGGGLPVIVDGEVVGGIGHACTRHGVRRSRACSFLWGDGINSRSLVLRYILWL